MRPVPSGARATTAAAVSSQLVSMPSTRAWRWLGVELLAAVDCCSIRRTYVAAGRPSTATVTRRRQPIGLVGRKLRRPRLFAAEVVISVQVSGAPALAHRRTGLVQPLLFSNACCAQSG